MQITPNKIVQQKKFIYFSDYNKNKSRNDIFGTKKRMFWTLEKVQRAPKYFF